MSKLQKDDNKGRSLRVTPVDFAVAEMRALPRLPTKRQDLKRLSGLVRLNQLMSAAAKAVEQQEGKAA